MFLLQLAAVFLQLTLLGPGTKYNSLKIAFGGISQLGSASYLFEHIKLPISSNFHVFITTSGSIFTINAFGAWDQVQQSKNSIWGHFSAGVCILSCSSPKTTFVDEVSCWYAILHNILANSPDYDEVTFSRLENL